MKLNQFVIAGMAVLALAACNKNNQGEAPVSTDGTYAQITFKESPLLAGKVNEGQKDQAGTEAESAVTSAYFMTESYSGSHNMVELNGFSAGTSEEAKVYTSKPFLYGGTTGALKSGLVVNGANLSQNDLREDMEITLAKGGTKMDTYAAANKFMMSSFSNVDITINSPVAEDEVKAKGNVFMYTVERISAKLQVFAPTNGIEVKELSARQNANVKYVGDVKDTRYALAGGAMKSYLFGNKSGERTLTGTDNPFKYKNFTSAIHNEAITSGSGASLTWRKNIQKVSDLVLHTHDTDAQFATLNSLPILKDENKLQTSDANGIYFLENSVSAPTYIHDIAHAKVYATFAFKADQKVYKLDTDKKVVEGAVTEIEAARDDEVTVTDEWVNKLDPAKKSRLEGAGKLTGAAGSYMLKIAIEANSFFVGESTGKVYVTLSAARADGNKATKLFKKGKMYWEVPANRQLNADGKTTGYADTRRNNIYSLLVKTISGLGDNWDNSDPEDPNIPKPNPEDNPDEPEKPEPKPTDPVETYIEVQAKILQWNLVHRGVDLH